MTDIDPQSVPIFGYEDYYTIDRNGVIRRIGKACGARIGAIKKHNSRKDRPYPFVRLYANSVGRTFDVHILLMLTFRGPPPSGMQVCHNDGNPLNCSLDNLRYDTPKGNASDRYRHGTINRGERNGRSRLTTDQVLHIKRLLAAGHSPIFVASHLAIPRQTINHIASGRRWGWL